MIEKFLLILKGDFFKSSTTYTVSTVLQKAIPFFLLPILTRYLTTEEYGIVAMFTVLVGFVSPFTGLGIKAAVLRVYYKQDSIDFSEYVFNALLILLTSTFLVYLFFYFFADIISKYTEFPESWLITVVLVAAGQFVIDLILVIWQAQFKALRYGIFQISLTALNFLVSIYLIIGLGFNWEGKVIGETASTIVFATIGFIIIYKGGFIKIKLVKKHIKHALGYGLPLIPHIVSSSAITMTDRIFITNMIGVDETGIYTVGYQVGMIIGVLAGAFNKAWTPYLYKALNYNSQEDKRKLVRYTYVYVIVILTITIILSLLSPWFLSFFVGSEFSGAAKFVFWVGLGYAFNGMYYMVTNYIFYEEKTHFLSWMSFFVAVINVVLNYFFIKLFGTIGAAQATAISYLLQFLITWIISNKVHPMPWFNFYEIKKND